MASNLVTQQDSVDLSQFVAPVVAFAAYAGGNFENWGLAVKRWPNALKKSIAVHPDENADILDVENGDAVPTDYPAWHQRQLARGLKNPMPYASQSEMPAVEAACRVAKVTLIGEWVAHFDGVANLSGQSSLVKAKQFTDRGFARNLDLSCCLPEFWVTPAPTPKNPPMYNLFYTGPFSSPYGDLNERLVVEQYDGARQHSLVYKLYLKNNLQPRLQWLADRVAYEAITNQVNGKPSWGVDHRGYRFQQLIHRAQGQRFV